ncbi:uncharacterized protein LOC127666675 [Apodemus sylvaticus]|uniref:uncharacterized protein LOC127666675 n=1 Tax=Apodemus sylvaticus TaxID=10129 RepID=UPI0022435A3B|nr:uncharacterized protein LOC127666675 [Apodemus sylvaticus]
MENPTGKKLELPNCRERSRSLGFQSSHHPAREAQTSAACFPSARARRPHTPETRRGAADGGHLLPLVCRDGQLRRGRLASGSTARDPRQTAAPGARTNPRAEAAGLPHTPLPPPSRSPTKPPTPTPALHLGPQLRASPVRLSPASTASGPRRYPTVDPTALTRRPSPEVPAVGVRRQNSSAARWGHAKRCSGGRGQLLPEEGAREQVVPKSVTAFQLAHHRR